MPTPIDLGPNPPRYLTDYRRPLRPYEGSDDYANNRVPGLPAGVSPRKGDTEELHIGGVPAREFWGTDGDLLEGGES